MNETRNNNTADADQASAAAARRTQGGGRPEGQPNYTLRRFLLAAGLGVSAVGAFLGGRALLSAHNQDELNSDLSQPIPNVAAEIRDGTIDPSDVTRFKVGDTEYAWTAASHITGEDHQGDTGTVSDIITAQQGNPVEAGSTVILPNSEVDHPDPMQK